MESRLWQGSSGESEQKLSSSFWVCAVSSIACCVSERKLNSKLNKSEQKVSRERPRFHGKGLFQLVAEKSARETQRVVRGLPRGCRPHGQGCGQTQQQTQRLCRLFGAVSRHRVAGSGWLSSPLWGVLGFRQRGSFFGGRCFAAVLASGRGDARVCQ